MEGVINFFQDMESLEPKCPSCGIVLEYGVNTKYNDNDKAHVCTKCGCVLK